AEGVARAAPEAVWERVANADSYQRWGPWTATGYQGPADPAAGGAGGIRWVRDGRTPTVGEGLGGEPARRPVCTGVKGSPGRNYRAEVTLRPEGEGTHVRWTASWVRTLPGQIVHRKLRTIYPDMLARLIAAAEHSARPART